MNQNTRVAAVVILYNPNDDVINNKAEWQTLLPAQKLSADNEHEFVNEINPLPGVTHVRLNIFPDGGISRLRLFGKKKV